jgi:hypothetical protein
VALLKAFRPFKINQYTKVHGSTLTNENVQSTSEVRTSAILGWLKLTRLKIMASRLPEMPRPSHLISLKNLPNGSNLIRGAKQSEMTISQVCFFPLGREMG